MWKIFLSVYFKVHDLVYWFVFHSLAICNVSSASLWCDLAILSQSLSVMGTAILLLDELVTYIIFFRYAWGWASEGRCRNVWILNWVSIKTFFHLWWRICDAFRKPTICCNLHFTLLICLQNVIVPSGDIKISNM